MNFNWVTLAHSTAAMQEGAPGDCFQSTIIRPDIPALRSRVKPHGTGCNPLGHFGTMAGCIGRHFCTLSGTRQHQASSRHLTKHNQAENTKTLASLSDEFQLGYFGIPHGRAFYVQRRPQLALIPFNASRFLGALRNSNASKDQILLRDVRSDFRRSDNLM